MELDDMVKLADGRVGVIENVEPDGFTVRIFVMNDDEYIATDDVVKLAESELTPLFDEAIDELEKMLDEEIEVEEDEEKAELTELAQGDFVDWSSAGGEAQGRVISLHTEGIVKPEGSDFEIEASEEKPVALIEVFERIEGGWQSTGIQVAHPVSILEKIEPLETASMDAPKSRIMVKFKSIELEETETESGEKVGYIEGIVSPYGNVDLGGDVVEKGAYKQFMNMTSKTTLQLDHGYTSKDVAGVAFYEDSEEGLKLKGEMNLNVQAVKDCYDMIKFNAKRGVDMGLSIGYETIKADYDKSGIRRLKELMLHESSITPFPMNTAARISSAKSRKLQMSAKRELWQQGRKRIHPLNGNESVKAELKSLLSLFTK
jgi:HK97 family phage prohead protease